MKPNLDLSLYLVTNRGTLALDDFFRIIKESIDGGVNVVQLREKESSVRETIEIGKFLRLLLRPLGIPLIINDRVDIAQAVNADGVHLGQSDLNVAEARAILGKQAIIGLSVETMEQALAAADDDVDYLAASPLFQTKTKATSHPPWGYDGLKQLCSISRHPVIAIGGINEANVKKVFECGVSGVAVVSAIFDAPSPKLAAMKLKEHF